MVRIYVTLREISCSVISQMSGKRLNPQPEDRGRANVLPGWRYCIPHGAVIDGDGAMMK